MRRVAVLLCLLMLTPLVSASPDPTVDLTVERRLSNFDIGINGGVVSPSGLTVLIFGHDGFAHVISATDAGDEAGDMIFTSFTGDTAKGTNTITGGTGKFAGWTGSGPWACEDLGKFGSSSCRQTLN